MAAWAHPKGFNVQPSSCSADVPRLLATNVARRSQKDVQLSSASPPESPHVDMTLTLTSVQSILGSSCGIADWRLRSRSSPRASSTSMIVAYFGAMFRPTKLYRYLRTYFGLIGSSREGVATRHPDPRPSDLDSCPGADFPS